MVGFDTPTPKVFSIHNLYEQHLLVPLAEKQGTFGVRSSLEEVGVHGMICEFTHVSRFPVVFCAREN